MGLAVFAAGLAILLALPNLFTFTNLNIVGAVVTIVGVIMMFLRM